MPLHSFEVVSANLLSEEREAPLQPGAAARPLISMELAIYEIS